MAPSTAGLLTRMSVSVILGQYSIFNIQCDLKFPCRPGALGARRRFNTTILETCGAPHRGVGVSLVVLLVLTRLL